MYFLIKSFVGELGCPLTKILKIDLRSKAARMPGSRGTPSEFVLLWSQEQVYQIWCFYAICHNFLHNGLGYMKETRKLSIICNLSLHQAPMFGTNPEKASNIMACRKNGELFYGSCNTKLHFMSLNIISPSQYKRANRLRDNCQQRTP